MQERTGRGIGESVFPQVDFVMLVCHGFYKTGRVRKAALVPGKCAGVSVRLPSRLQTKNITWDVAISKFFCERESILVIRPGCHPVPEAKTPLRRHKSSAGKDVVTLDRILHFRPGKQIHVYPRSARHLNDDPALVALTNCVRIIRVGIGSGSYRRSFAWLRPRIAKIECCVAGGVDEDPHPFGRYIKWHRRVRIATVVLGIGVHARYLLLSALRERQHLQPKTEDLLIRPQRQLHHAAARCLFAFNGRQRSRIYTRQLRKRFLLRWHKAAGNWSESLRRSDGCPPYAGMNLFPAMHGERARD